MKVKEIAVRKLFNLGNYENLVIELRFTVEEGDDVNKVYAEGYFLIHELFKASEVERAIDKKVEGLEERESYLTNKIVTLSEQMTIWELERKKKIRELEEEIKKYEVEYNKCKDELERYRELLKRIRKLLKEGQVKEVVEIGCGLNLI